MKGVLKVVICVLLVGFFWAAPCLAQDTVNINAATVEELTALPGIGPVIAGKIVEYREAKPFDTIEEIQEVKGIGLLEIATALHLVEDSISFRHLHG